MPYLKGSKAPYMTLFRGVSTPKLLPKLHTFPVRASSSKGLPAETSVCMDATMSCWFSFMNFSTSRLIAPPSQPEISARCVISVTTDSIIACHDLSESNVESRLRVQAVMPATDAINVNFFQDSCTISMA